MTFILLLLCVFAFVFKKCLSCPPSLPHPLHCCYFNLIEELRIFQGPLSDIFLCFSFAFTNLLDPRTFDLLSGFLHVVVDSRKGLVAAVVDVAESRPLAYIISPVPTVLGGMFSWSVSGVHVLYMF